MLKFAPKLQDQLKTFQESIKTRQMEIQYEEFKMQLKQRREPLKQSNAQQLFGLMNAIAMRYAREHKLQLAETWLNRSYKYIRYNPKLEIVITNNYSCIYKKMNKYEMALQYLYQNQQLIHKFYSDQTSHHNVAKMLADLYTNYSAVLSAMGRHEPALNYAKKGLEVVNQYHMEGAFIICKHNEAVELEHIHRYEEALQAYEQLKEQISEANDIYPRVTEAMLSLKKKLQPKKGRNLSYGDFSSVRKRTSSIASENRLPVSQKHFASLKVPEEKPRSQRNSFWIKHNTTPRKKRIILEVLNIKA